MELAIPIIALGGLFIVGSQRRKNNKKDNFESMGKPRNYLPNVDTLPQNYPVVNVGELVDTVQQYPNPNQATDKYFNQTYFENKNNEGIKTGENIQSVYSLTGNYLESNEFKHNNMVPFYGGKMYGGNFKDDMAQSQLDNMVGTGSQTIKKIEQAPLFKPEDNIQWAYGSPDMSDFYQSRVNPGTVNNHALPFQQQNVGPGLNKGFSSEGSNGFNSGMEARDLWLDKTVDELRIATNPKESFSLFGLEGPAEAPITNVGKIGTVEKYRPDTFFINTQDRWLTTTGQEKGNRLVPIEMIKDGKSNIDAINYMGPATSALKTAGYTPINTELSKRNELESFDKYPTHSYGGNAGHTDIHLKNTFIEKNNRSSNSQSNFFGANFNRSIGAAILPFMDILKPTRKEEFSCNLYLGGAGSSVSQYNNNKEKVSSTIKESTLYTPHSFVGQQIGGGYMTNNQTPTGTQRTTTGMMNYMGPVGGDGNSYGNPLYNSSYAQTNNDNKEASIMNRTNQGNMNIYSPTVNMSIHKTDKETCYVSPPNTVFGSVPSVEQMGVIDMPSEDNKCMTDRIQPDLLNAFRENPYTHSLTYAV